MNNPLKQIVLVFILIAMLPIGFIVYELSTLNKNEQIVKEIYQNQLDAILYSVNQYSDDVMSSWANRIGIILGLERTGIKQDSTTSLRSFLSQTNAIRFFYESDLKTKSTIHSSRKDEASEHIRLLMDSIVNKNPERIKKLFKYQQAGFRKMEAINVFVANDDLPVFFVFDDGHGKYLLGAIILDLPGFVQNTLAPKMQAISQDKFIISAFKESNDSLIYSTGSINPVKASTKIIKDLKDESQKKEFWLLPGYYLGISLKAATIDDLVRDRMMTSITILSLLMVILIAGILFLYRNIRREIYLSRAKSEFVSNVSHEIRTPLSLISMYAETLEMDRVNEDKKKSYYSIIAKETARLSKIVNRILNFSQIEANKKRYHFEPVLLHELCREIMESYFLPMKDMGFACEITADEVPEIQGDRDSISEAIMNLLDNAIKYSREIKHITMKVTGDSRFVYVEVKDEGMGIAKNHQQEIFGQFYRVPTGDVHNTKGSGLGLTLVKKTMEAHHGKIKVESVPGKGSTFRLSFPVKKVEIS